MPCENFSIEKIQDEFSIAIRDIPNPFEATLRRTLRTAASPFIGICSIGNIRAVSCSKNSLTYLGNTPGEDNIRRRSPKQKIEVSLENQTVEPLNNPKDGF